MVDLLDTVRVLDFTHVHAGPLCTYQLALMGAKITKIESIDGGDQMRGMGPEASSEMPAGFVGQNANKQSLALDLKAPKGLAIAKRLLADADVLVHNMRPGTMDRLGLGVDAVKQINPLIIYCAISGYGQDGPNAQRPALDHLMQGESGMFDATGLPEGPAVRVGFAVADASTAVIASSAICAALFRRERTGQGAYLDVSMLECCLTVMGLNAYNYLGSGFVHKRVGPNPLAKLGSVGTFTTQRGTLLVNANNYRLFERMAQAVGRADLIERYPAGQVFRSNWEALRQTFADIFATRDADFWEELLTAAGVPVGQVRPLPDVFTNPQLAYRRAVTDLDGQRHVNAGFQVDGAPTAPQSAAPTLGEHSVAVLEAAGLRREEISALRDDGIVA
ncbi:MAG: CoA transferase [Pseudomonadota bacterium]